MGPTTTDEKLERAPHPRSLSSRKRFLFAALTLSIPIVLFSLLEGLCAWKFHRDFAGKGTNLSTQGRFRYVPAAFEDYTHNPNYVRRIDDTEYRYNNHGFRN